MQTHGPNNIVSYNHAISTDPYVQRQEEFDYNTSIPLEHACFTYFPRVTELEVEIYEAMKP